MAKLSRKEKLTIGTLAALLTLAGTALAANIGLMTGVIGKTRKLQPDEIASCEQYTRAMIEAVGNLHVRAISPQIMEDCLASQEGLEEEWIECQGTSIHYPNSNEWSCVSFETLKNVYDVLPNLI